MWFFFTPEQLAAIEAQKIAEDTMICGICNGEIFHNKLYLSVNLNNSQIFPRKFHSDCIISHFYLNGSDMEDETLNYILKVT